MKLTDVTEDALRIAEEKENPLVAGLLRDLFKRDTISVYRITTSAASNRNGMFTFTSAAMNASQREKMVNVLSYVSIELINTIILDSFARNEEI